MTRAKAKTVGTTAPWASRRKSYLPRGPRPKEYQLQISRLQKQVDDATTAILTAQVTPKPICATDQGVACNGRGCSCTGERDH